MAKSYLHKESDRTTFTDSIRIFFENIEKYKNKISSLINYNGLKNQAKILSNLLGNFVQN